MLQARQHFLALGKDSRELAPEEFVRSSQVAAKMVNGYNGIDSSGKLQLRDK